MILVDEQVLISLGVAQQPDTASLGGGASCVEECHRVLAMGPEALLLWPAPRHAELASLLRGIGRRLLEEGDVVGQAITGVGGKAGMRVNW